MNYLILANTTPETYIDEDYPAYTALPLTGEAVNFLLERMDRVHWLQQEDPALRRITYAADHLGGFSLRDADVPGLADGTADYAVGTEEVLGDPEDRVPPFVFNLVVEPDAFFARAAEKHCDYWVDSEECSRESLLAATDGNVSHARPIEERPSLFGERTTEKSFVREYGEAEEST